MHSAPSVNYPVGRSRLVAGALLAAWLTGACAVVGWRYQIDRNVPADDWRQWVLLAALLLAAAGAWRTFRTQPAQGELRWDGQYWLLATTRDHGGALATVHLDLQSLMLVRVAPADTRAQWLWLQRHRAPARWRALRRALYSRAPSPEDVTAESASGTPQRMRAHSESTS